MNKGSKGEVVGGRGSYLGCGGGSFKESLPEGEMNEQKYEEGEGAR